VQSLQGTGDASAGGPEVDLGEAHWRPARCITAYNIPHSHLISLIKLRTNSHGWNIEMLRHPRPPVSREQAERVLGVTPLMYSMS
jgi:hypothetical protein